MRARARLDRYLAGRGREDGHVVLELLDEAAQLMQGDPGPLELRLELFCRIGAWADAHLLVARLLELQPGDPELEDRYRALQPLVEDSPTVERALRDVEQSGHLVDEEAEGMGKAAIDSRSIRPRLKELKAMEGVHAAIYTRGATALVQGPKGATAERIARATPRTGSGPRDRDRGRLRSPDRGARQPGRGGRLVQRPAARTPAPPTRRAGEPRRPSDGGGRRVIEALEPLASLPGVRLVILVAPDGVCPVRSRDPGCPAPSPTRTPSTCAGPSERQPTAAPTAGSRPA
jgi:hypothetical protein